MPVLPTKTDVQVDFEFTQTISEDGKVVGTIRIRPDQVAWKNGKSGRYRYATIEEFRKWISLPR